MTREVSVSYEDKIDQLVTTVRDLNHQIRPQITNVPGGDPPGNPRHEALAELRDHEQTISRTLKLMTLGELGVSAADTGSAQATNEIGSRSLLSEFATAREAILATLHAITDDEWEEEHDTADGSTTVNTVIDSLIESDKVLVPKVVEATGS